MTIGSQPRETEYEVVVVGAGLGGLSAAGFLAKAGKRVLLAEAQEALGGYAHAFRRGDYTFDPAIHFTAQTADGKLLDQVLRILGVRDRCNFLSVDSLYQINFPDLSFTVPPALADFVAAHIEQFPGEAAGIAEFMRVCNQVTDESRRVPPQLSLRELDNAVNDFPLFFRYRTATAGEVLNEYITDQRVKAVLPVSWPYIGLPPSRIGFFPWSNLLMSVMDGGPVYCQGGFESLVNALAFGIEANGGEIVVNNKVNRITVEGDRVTGVELASGDRVRADVVVSNANAPETFRQLVGEEHFPSAYVRRLGRMEPSLSAFVLFTASTLDIRQFHPAHEMFVYKHWDHDETYRDILAGKPGGMWLSVPTLVDPSIAPPGEHIVIATCMARYDLEKPWAEERERFSELLLNEIETAFPGYRAQMTFRDSATPLTLERYSLNPGGPIYGWAATPVQTGTQRLARRTPLDGLYLAGAWTQPGSGSPRAIWSGILAAQELLGYRDPDEFFAALSGPAAR